METTGPWRETVGRERTGMRDGGFEGNKHTKASREKRRAAKIVSILLLVLPRRAEAETAVSTSASRLWKVFAVR